LFDRIFEYLDMPIDIKDRPGALQLKPEEIKGEITFKDVSFTYKHDEAVTKSDGARGDKQSSSTNEVQRPISPMSMALRTSSLEEPRITLNHVSFDIKPGQLAALVGPSGAGKTTMTYMVPRLYDVDS